MYQQTFHFPRRIYLPRYPNDKQLSLSCRMVYPAFLPPVLTHNYGWSHESRICGLYTYHNIHMELRINTLFSASSDEMPYQIHRPSAHLLELPDMHGRRLNWLDYVTVPSPNILPLPESPLH